MRARLCAALLAVIGFVAVVVYVCRNHQNVAQAPDEAPPVASRNAADNRSLRKELRAEVTQYGAAKDWWEASEIANRVASAHSHLWEKCSRNSLFANLEDRLALAHFASAYSQRGPQQKEELTSLLHSTDRQLVRELLDLLGACEELGPNGGWSGKGLGGEEIVCHIAQVYDTRPSLGFAVASTLRLYGPMAKGQIPTLLRIALSRDDIDVFEAVTALRSLDREGVSTRFGLGATQPLTDMQREAIEEHLARLAQ